MSITFTQPDSEQYKPSQTVSVSPPQREYKVSNLAPRTAIEGGILEIDILCFQMVEVGLCKFHFHCSFRQKEVYLFGGSHQIRRTGRLKSGG